MPSFTNKGEPQMKFRILIVEDEVIVQKIHQLMLEKLGCLVDIAADGIQAMNKYFNGNYELVLLDCGLPEVGEIKAGGFEICKRIRQHEEKNNLEQVPIVMVSAYSQEDLALECELVGINKIVTKPIGRVEMERLLKLISRH